MRKIGKIIVDTLFGFYEDGLSSRAAALTYFTLMSIIPVFAVVLGLARGFGFSSILEGMIADQLKEQPEVANYSIDFAYKLLDQTSSGVIAGIGVLILLWSVYNILGSIEEAFNHIWRVSSARSWVRKITDYISTIIICPLFFVISSSITIYIRTYFGSETGKALIFENYLLFILPYIATWILFTFLYFFLPNRRIPLKYGITAVIVAGTFYQLLQIFYIAFQLKLSSYGAVYGSFAALPLFLIWLNLSWMIILAGAELAHRYELADLNDSPNFDNANTLQVQPGVLATMLVSHIINRFLEEKRPFTVDELAEEIGVARAPVENILTDLVNKHLLIEIDDENHLEKHYQPAKNIDSFSIKTVVDLFPDTFKTITIKDTEVANSFIDAVNMFKEESVLLPANLKLKKLGAL